MMMGRLVVSKMFHVADTYVAVYTKAGEKSATQKWIYQDPHRST